MHQTRDRKRPALPNAQADVGRLEPGQGDHDFEGEELVLKLAPLITVTDFGFCLGCQRAGWPQGSNPLGPPGPFDLPGLSQLVLRGALARRQGPVPAAGKVTSYRDW